MYLQVVIPTYNRSELLPVCLRSLKAASVPDGLTVGITVVDNNSTDNTAAVVESWKKQFKGRLQYLFEEKQGRSSALNKGINGSSSDLIGFVDDDEEVDESWYHVVQQAFTTRDVDFIGGPYIPNWEQEPPTWLPRDHQGVIGVVDAGSEIIPYDENYPGILMGGNAVIRRSTIEEAGLYTTSLGRTGARLLAGEDEDMYRRLLASGAKGLYLPELKIYHLIPASRLTKKYYRQWSFWRGVSCGVLDRTQPQNVSYLCGVPRYLFGAATRGLWRWTTAHPRAGEDSPRAFSNELAIWDLAGFFYGKHFYKSESV
ncbi:MAG TPA: glycosyltransferase [Pyrinomonadaceae bacterium]|nr:glycosyltransferase [Pyrinomonadaceae bacterium]